MYLLYTYIKNPNENGDVKRIGGVETSEALNDLIRTYEADGWIAATPAEYDAQVIGGATKTGEPAPTAEGEAAEAPASGEAGTEAKAE